MQSNDDLLRSNIDLDLHTACRIGNIDLVRYIVEILQEDINTADAHNSPPLYYAALCGHKYICQYLLDNGAQCSHDAQYSAHIYYAALNDDIRQMLQEYNLSTASVNPYYKLLRRTFNDRQFVDVELHMQHVDQSIFLHSFLICSRCPTLIYYLS